MEEFLIQDDGLATFPILESRFGVRNYVTYENRKWENMNPYYSTTKEDRKRIEDYDDQIAERLGADTALVLTTPPEDTFVDMTTESLEYLKFVNLLEKDESVRYILVHANAVILAEKKVEVVVAPADCAVVVLKQERWDGMLVLHVGSPQVVENLHHKVLTYVSAAYPHVDISAFEAFIFPYICPRHYLLKEEKRERYVSTVPEIKKYLRPVENGEGTGFAFIKYMRDSLRDNWGIKNFRESGKCTWEETQNGNLFSNDYAEMVEEEKGKDFALESGIRGSFNVVVAMK